MILGAGTSRPGHNTSPAELVSSRYRCDSIQPISLVMVELAPSAVILEAEGWRGKLVWGKTEVVGPNVSNTLALRLLALSLPFHYC